MKPTSLVVAPLVQIQPNLSVSASNCTQPTPKPHLFRCSRWSVALGQNAVSALSRNARRSERASEAMQDRRNWVRGRMGWWVEKGRPRRRSQCGCRRNAPTGFGRSFRSLASTSQTSIERVKAIDVTRDVRFVAYLRVANKFPSKTDLEVQRRTVQSLARRHGAPIVGEYVEVECGTYRPRLDQALEAGLKSKAILLIARLDRLSSDIRFVARLLNSGSELPHVISPLPRDPLGR